eukprot:1043416_1
MMSHSMSSMDRSSDRACCVPLHLLIDNMSFHENSGKVYNHHLRDQTMYLSQDWLNLMGTRNISDHKNGMHIHSHWDFQTMCHDHRVASFIHESPNFRHVCPHTPLNAFNNTGFATISEYVVLHNGVPSD